MSLWKNIHLAFLLSLSVAGCSGGGGGGGSDNPGGDPNNPGAGGTNLYSINVSTTGLTGSGLVLKLVTLTQIDNLDIASDGTKSFNLKLATDSSYTIFISAQPSGQTCSLGSNSVGAIAGADVTVALACSNNPTAPTGTKVQVDLRSTLVDPETVTLTLNGTETKTFTRPVWGNASFSTGLNDGDSFEVAIKTPPTGKFCNLYNSTGVITGGVSPVVSLKCAADTTPTYKVSGAVTSVNGNGLRLKLNGAESTGIAPGSTSYAFTTPLLNGSDYNVIVETHPQGQICTVNNGSSSISGADRTNVDVICSDGTHAIGGSVTGLKGAGLMLSLNGVENLPIPTGGPFVFNIAMSDGMRYAATVKTQPVGQTCTVYRGEGSNISTKIDNILVECVDNRYQVGATVTGFKSGSTPLVLLLNGMERMELASTSSWSVYMFDSELLDGATYEVSILAHPSGQHCTLANAAGTISGADVKNIAATCITQAATSGPYTVSVTTSGLIGSGLQLSFNGGSSVDVVTNGSLTLPTSLNNGTAYAVSVAAQPTGPLQRCRIENGSGTITGANITNVAVVCENAAAPLFPANGARWLDYVKNPAVITTALPDVACEPGTDSYEGINACLNGGEYRVIEADYLTSCEGVNAVDDLNAFDWTCDQSSGKVRILSTAKPGLLLSDLVDFDAASFKKNFVTITAPGSTQVTQPSIWWQNLVRVDNSGEFCCSYDTNDIVLVTDNVPGFYTIRSNNALLIRPGFAISGYTDSKYIVTSYPSTYDGPNFLWLEGKIDDLTGGTSGGVSLEADFSVLQNVQVTNTGGAGVHLSGSNVKLRNVIATGNAGQGIVTWGHNHDADGLTATGNQGTGAAINITSYTSSKLANIVASDNPNAEAGLHVPSPADTTLENVTANNNGGDGVSMGEWTGSGIYPQYVVRNVTANGNLGTGFFAEVMDSGEVSNLSAHRNGGNGVRLDTGTHSPVTNIDVSGNTLHGLVVYRWEGTTVDQVKTSNNGGHGLLVEQSSKLIVSNITSANNGAPGADGADGIYLDSNEDCIYTNVTSSNNARNGIVNYTNSSSWDANVFLGVTTVNNGANGMESTRLEGFQFSSLLSAYNVGHGLYTYDFVYDQVFANFASANNGGYGINLEANRNYFTGLLTLGNNASGNCWINAVFNTESGLTARGGTKAYPSGDCLNANLSDALIVQNADLGSSLVGALATDDGKNPDDSLGSATYQTVSAWTVFDHEYRSWGKEGTPGRCTQGETCRIWDWSVATGDVGNNGAPALRNVLPVPTTGNETLSITWLVAQMDQSKCDETYPGSTFNGTQCVTTYLRNAIEIAGDGAGNDNHLCESNETCLFTPNIGSYQGHGALIGAGNIGTGGTITNVTLKRFASNGR